ncbi:MAG TPA: tetratricopeptide repeat protein [Oxalicibacterium sp.]|nr:tetratricopeptide repeat protein [Oxalicibacterium sp.]
MPFVPRRILPSILPDAGLSKLFGRAVVISGLLAGLHAPAMADELADVSQLLRAGQQAQALKQADAFLAKNPRNAQMRFLKGVILTEQNKSNEAIVVFTKLTEDYPALPEPYNNLAVLYAASGQYEKARVALDKAIHTNPTYATAYENLGDVHAKLASEAYDKALQLDSKNSNAKAKLTMIHSLVDNTTGVINPKVATVAAAPQAESKPAPKAEPKPEAKPEPKPVVKEAPKPDAQAERAAELKREKEEKQKEQKEQKQKEEAEKRDAKAKASAAANAEREQVMAAVNSWAKAWSARDVKAYLNAYSGNFDLPAKQSRKDWAEERRARIEDKKYINVKIENPQVVVNGNTATVKFRQTYDSDRVKANSRKTLVLSRQGGKWQITQERSGS